MGGEMDRRNGYEIGGRGRQADGMEDASEANMSRRGEEGTEYW